MFGLPKKEAPVVLEKEFAFEYRFYMSNGEFGSFECTRFTEEEAEERRGATIATLLKAMTEKSCEMLDVNIGVNGSDVSWFYVGDIKERYTA